MRDLYRIKNPSNKEMKFIRKLHDTFPVSLSLLIPSVGNPKLTATNCILTKQDLQFIYFDNETSADSKIDEYNEKYGGGTYVVTDDKKFMHILNSILLNYFIFLFDDIYVFIVIISCS